jgi:uncharacterized delta-60 repeat protein
MKKLAVSVFLLSITFCVLAQQSAELVAKGRTEPGNGIFMPADGAFIYMAAAGGNFYSCRLLPNGDLDDAYNGIRTSKKTYGQLIDCKTITAQRDKWGRLLIGGSSRIDSESGRVATMVRLAKNGNPDADFVPGIVQLKVGDSSEFIGIYLLSDEKIMTLGWCYTDGAYHLFLSRFQYNGEKDLSFGKNGVIIDNDTPANDKDMLTAIQPDGKYIVAGAIAGDKGATIIKRYNTDGSKDTAFAHTGFVTIKGYSSASPVAMLLQPDGKIVVAGNCAEGKSAERIFVARLDVNGLFDTSFGKSGITLPAATAGSKADDMALLPDGQLLLAGQRSVKGAAPYDRYIMLRLSPDGKAENGYGYGGLNSLPPHKEGASVANKLVIRRDGKVDRLREQVSANEVETILNFTTYLQDSSLGLVDIPAGKLQHFIYPVPVTKEETFSFSLVEDLAITTKLLGADGSEIAIIKNKEPYTEGDNSIRVVFPATCKPGKYFVVLSGEPGYKVTIEVTKI